LQITLGEICSFTNGGTPKKSVPEYWTGDIPFITGADIDERNGTITEPRGYITEEAISKSSTNLIPTESILLVTRTGVGKVAIPPHPVCVSQDFTALSFDSKVVHQRYLFHVLRCAKESFVSQARGATIQGITREVVSSFRFDLPAYSEQERIAAILDKAEVIRLESEKIMNLKDNIIQGLFFEIFGDPILNPKGWDKVTVKEIATIVRGSSPRPKGDPRYYGEGIPRLMVADLTRDGMYVTPSIDSLTVEGAKKSRSMMKGDLVMAVSGRPGLPAILNVDCCIHDGFAGFRDLSQNFNKVFLYHYFKLYISQVSKRSVGAIFKNITTSDIRNIELFDVSLGLQNDFADVVQSITSIDFNSLHNQILNLGKSISQEILT
jgi:type I restriction enzyme, S subunit